MHITVKYLNLKGRFTMENKTIIGFSELIRNYRKEKKITQVAFGKLIDRNQVTVSNYEKGIHFPNNAEEIRAIAALINQPGSYVLDAIEYSKKGVIKQHEALFIDLDKLDDHDLENKYKFLVAGEEVTGEELKEMLKLLKFERFNKRNED